MQSSSKLDGAVSAVAKLRLPYPYLTTYHAIPTSEHHLKIQLSEDGPESPPQDLHSNDLQHRALEPPQGTLPEVSNNSAWARARRSYSTTITWHESQPSLAQIWLVVYMIFTQTPDHEVFRMRLEGPSAAKVAHQLRNSTLAISHPSPEPSRPERNSKEGSDELIVLRSTFWQGAASPFGERSVWIPSGGGSANVETVSYTMTTKFPDTRVHAWHPQRSAKPAPGSMIYSRYIPALDEHFSMIALDYENPEHLDLFHTWQNDPRVAAGWNETGTLEEHRTYLRNLHEDPHVLTVIALFEDIPFAYFEIYWAAEDHLGAHYQAEPFDRGRHALVGNPEFRGRHRVTAWWSATMHYIFLDDPRTDRVVGEPKYTNTSVLAYDLMHGFSVAKFVDLPHKRSALMICSRERFFQLNALDHAGGVVGGTHVPLPAKI
ncbi:hypothetical protein H2198_004653 [Neophaeococcomyces mojaviensis]|uniref:Uncharacterized protein n=1 Tax=Neophaeococcomyces mojaviensis TaxID=3383035 RepID=A0ACC3A7X5_9EURO|nr:hypothetical protein H2198_004653 [Knufia sp. JES_112]